MVLSAIRGALGEGPVASKLDSSRCPYLSSDSGERPQRVIEGVEVSFAPFRDRIETGQLVTTAKIKNTGDAALPSPISIVVRGRFDLANADGTACNLLPGWGSSGYRNVYETLLPGAERDVTLILSPRSREKIGIEAEVFAGPGRR